MSELDTFLDSVRARIRNRPIRTCPVCGVFVMDPAIHDRWHAKLAGRCETGHIWLLGQGACLVCGDPFKPSETE